MKDNNSQNNLIKIIKSKVFGSSNYELKKQVMLLMTQKDRFEKTYYIKLSLGFIDLETLNSEELLWFAQAMEDVGNKLGVDLGKVTDFFTEYDIKNVKYYTREKIDISSLLVLHNAFKLAENQYQAVISVKQLALAKKYGLFRVDPNVQRQSKEVKIKSYNKQGTEVLRQIQTYHKKIKEIKEMIVEDKYHYNAIRLNLVNDGSAKFIFDEGEGKIYLPEDGDILIIDGNNRTLADEQSYCDHPELEELYENRFFGVFFTYYDIDTAKDCISQEWKVTPVNTKHIKTMERSYANYVVDEIMRSREAEDVYKNNIVTTGVEAYMKSGFIVHSILSDAIEKYYNVNSYKLKDDIKTEVIDWLIKFFNYLSKIMIDDFYNFKTLRREKWSVSQYAWIGYTFLSYKLKDDSDWQNKLEKIMLNIDWNMSAYPVKQSSKCPKYYNIFEDFFTKELNKYV